MSGGDLAVRRGLVIPDSELNESASRSGGPGGQNVNKVNTRVSLRWSPARSTALSPTQRARILAALTSRLTTSGELIVHAGRARTQARNREAARERLAEMVREALHTSRSRIATKPTRGSKERTLATKKRRADIKRRRGPVRGDDP